MKASFCIIKRFSKSVSREAPKWAEDKKPMHAPKSKACLLTQLTKRADFLLVQNKGRKWVSHGLIIQVRANEMNTHRIGFTVSKRVDKSAVKRNRIKRRLRAVAADILPDIAPPGYDYVLVGRKETLNRPYQTLCKDLRWCLRKMGLEKETQ